MSSEKETDWSQYAVSDQPVNVSRSESGPLQFSWNYVLGANQIDAATVKTVNCPRCCHTEAPADGSQGSSQYVLVNDTHVCGLQSSVHSQNCTTFAPIGQIEFAVSVQVDGGVNNGQSQEMIIPPCNDGFVAAWVIHPAKMDPLDRVGVFAADTSGVQIHKHDPTLWLLVVLLFLFVMR